MAGASPEIMASTVAEPLERRLATIAGVNELTSQSSVGSAAGGHSVRHQPRHQWGRARCGGGHSGRARRPADDPARESQLPQIQPGRLADHHSGANLENSHHGPALRFGRHRHSAAALADLRRRSDPAGRQRPALGAGRDPARQALELRHRARGRARRHLLGECRQRQGAHRPGRAALRGDVQRSGDQGCGLSKSGHRLPQRCARTAARCGGRRGLEREHPQCRPLQ